MNYSKSYLNQVQEDQDNIKEQIQEDFVKADIYFKSLNVQTIKQEKKYTVSVRKNYSLTSKFFSEKQGDSFLSSIGGSISLYLGIAVIMVFEILELGLDLVLRFFKNQPMNSTSMC